LQSLDEEIFATALEARPALISFTLGDPSKRVQQAHDAGTPVMFQFTGQSAGLIREILPVGEIVRRIMAEAEETLKAAFRFLS